MRNTYTRSDEEPKMDHSMIPILDRGCNPQAFRHPTSTQFTIPQKLIDGKRSVKPPRPPPLDLPSRTPWPSRDPSRSPSPTLILSARAPHSPKAAKSSSGTSKLGSFEISERVSPTISLSRPPKHGHSASDATDCSVSTVVSDLRTPLIDPYYSSVESNGWMGSPKSMNSISAGNTLERTKPVRTVSPQTYFSPVVKISTDYSLSRLEQPSIRRVPPQIQTISRPNYPRRKDSLPSASEGDRFSGSTIAPSPVYVLFPKQEPIIPEQEPKSVFDDYDDEPTTRYRSFSSSIRWPLRSSTHDRSKAPAGRSRRFLRKVFCCGCFTAH